MFEAITRPQHTQVEATGDEDRSNLQKHWTEQESPLFQDKVKEKPCSQDTEKSSRSAHAQ